MTASIFERPQSTPASGEHGGAAGLEQAIAAKLSLNSAQVHEIDFEDLMLKQSVMKTIGSMAGELLRRFMGESADVSALTAVAPMVKERAYWIEETKELVLAVIVGDETHLIQVPKDAWTVTERSCH